LRDRLQIRFIEDRIDYLISPYSMRINFDALSNMYKINARFEERRPLVLQSKIKGYTLLADSSLSE